MHCWEGTGTSPCWEPRRIDSVYVFVTGWDPTCMVESKARCNQSNGNGIYANIHPTAVVDSKPEVEYEAQKEAPSRHCALAATNRWVCKSSPSVVDNQRSSPFGNTAGLVNGLHSKSDHCKACRHEDSISKRFVVESINGDTKRWVSGFEG